MVLMGHTHGFNGSQMVFLRQTIFHKSLICNADSSYGMVLWFYFIYSL